MEIIILIAYGTALTLILIYSIMQMTLVAKYLSFHKRNNSSDNLPIIEKPDKLPFVTIQLPVYNELYVVNRLIESVAKLNYPKDKFEIQLLDDSDDESVEVAAKKVKEISEKGINISHIRRKDRTGFKAGALDYGLNIARGELIAIFDADFIPESDFLIKTVPHFDDSKVGVVQTKWGHINKKFSMLTELQAFGLNAHFSVEQTGRNFGGYFINFNGTAGVWRKLCIVNAGGWEHDTLTEDLDLSYRAQLKGWKFKYLENVESPAELPVAMSALKNQQFRWNKGGAENFVKFFKTIMRANIPLKNKIYGLFHLLNSSIFILVLITSVLSVPVLFIKSYYLQYAFLFSVSSLFLICTLFLMIFYYVSYEDKQKNLFLSLGKFIGKFFLFLSFSMGLSLHNSVAVIEGYLGKKSSFIRTPKFNVISGLDKWKNNKYLKQKIDMITIFEGILALYFLSGVISAYLLHEKGLLPFHIMLTLGFGAVFYYSVFHERRKAKKV